MNEDGILRRTFTQKDMDFDEKLFKEKVLKCFQVFDNFCHKHGLNYSVGFGTMLGAVRHKGFIPWDDDMDVIMPRPDYDRFIQLTLNGIADGYSVISYKNKENYWLLFAKVIDTNTCLIEQELVKNCPFGVYIDVFPVDGIKTYKDSKIKLKV